MKMYRVDWGTRLSEYEVVKHTDKTVTYIDPYWNKETRTNKISSYHRWFESRDEAIAYVRSKLMLQIETSEKNIAAARATLAEIDRG